MIRMKRILFVSCEEDFRADMKQNTLEILPLVHMYSLKYSHPFRDKRLAHTIK